MITDAAKVLDGVKDLLPVLRERSAEAEDLRRMPDATAADLKDVGVMRLLQPSRYGGFEADPRIFYESVLAIASADGSAGWVSGVVGVHPWQMALFDDRVQAEIWSDDPNVWVSSSYMPGGKLVPVDGGYRLSGRWSFSSGCQHCDWVVVGTPIDRADGEPPVACNTLLPRADYQIDDVWFTMGLKGTGSNDIVVDDVFVPEYRTLTGEQLFAGSAPGHAVNTGPLYKLPFAAMFANVITGPIIGMAEGMYGYCLEYIKGRVSNAWGRVLENDPYTVAALGEAAREIEACRMQLLNNIGDLYDTAVRGDEITMEQRSRARRDQVLGTVRAVAAIDGMFDRTGAGSIYSKSPMQRLFRDAHTAKHHTANTNERTLFSYAHNAMGLGPTDYMV